MKAFSMAGFRETLMPDREDGGAVWKGRLSIPGVTDERAAENPSAGGLDSFDLQKCVSELLSPACGMTEEEKAEFMRRIMAKLQSGRRLTQDELMFLQAEDPQLYQQVARVQNMRNSFEEQLRHVHSREEAQQLFGEYMSNVPDDDPMKEYLVAAYGNVMAEFEGSGDYAKLPGSREANRR